MTETVTGVVLDHAYDYGEDAREDPGNVKSGSVGVDCFLDASRFNIEEIKKVGDKVVLEMPDHCHGPGKNRGIRHL